MPSNPPDLGWESLLTVTIPEWTFITDYTFAVKKTGASSLRLTIDPTQKSYTEISIKFEVSYEDTNHHKRVTSIFGTEISQVEINESLESFGAVSGAVGGAAGDFSPFISIIFPAFGTILTNFLIVKNMFK